MAALVASLAAAPAAAHPAPFSYLDLHLDADGTRGVLVIHDFDAAYELGMEDPATLLATEVAASRGPELERILDRRLGISADSRPASFRWQAVEVLPDRQSLRFAFTLTSTDTPGRIEIDTVLFPYDPNHQTFISVYENGSLRGQAILDADRRRFEHYTGTAQGRAAVVRAFIVSGFEHILIGPDHVLFLLGLLLLGGSFWRLATIVTAFTLGHSVTLSLAALDFVRVSPSLIEPAIALSIVVVGVDNLLVRQRRAAQAQAQAQAPGVDLRPFMAVAFGLIHGFGFAAVLREVGLPPDALAWSLFAFNVGVELGQLAVVGLFVALLAAIRRYDVVLAESGAVVASMVVIGAGLYWFAQRVGLIA
jgi:hypothetical protein